MATTAGGVATTPATASWPARPLQAAALRVFILLAPVGAALTTAALLAPLLPAARSMGERLTWWLLLCLLSTGPLLLTDRAVRRLLPLSSLLRLSMLFPDRAPSRLKVARQAASVRDLQRKTEAARREGIADEPAKAAETILTLITALSQHDPRTRGHSERVHLYVEMLAKELGIPEADRAKLRWAALVHDIGKIEISAALLNKPGPPDTSEWEELRRHPIEGARFCIPLREWLGEWASAIEQHHEHWDGSGYPLGLAGEAISRAARIVAVADAYETMTAARPYKKPLSAAAAREELARGAGTQFDPEIVRAFLSLSVARVRWAGGAMSWIAQWPLVGQLPRLGEVVAVSSVTAAGAATLAVGGFVAPGQASFGVWPDAPPPVQELVGSDVVPPPADDAPSVTVQAAPEDDGGGTVVDAEAGDEVVEVVEDHDSWDRGSEARTLSRPRPEPVPPAQTAPASAGPQRSRATPEAVPAPSGPIPSSLDEPLAPGDSMPGNKPELFPGGAPVDGPGNVPVEMPGNRPEVRPGNPDPGTKPDGPSGNKPEGNPGNKPDEPPGNRPSLNPGQGSAGSPGNRPETPPGQGSAGSPANSPDVPPGQAKKDE